MQCEDIQPRKDLCMHRVKLYKLNQQGLWDDKGTGHVGIEFLPVRSAHSQRTAFSSAYLLPFVCSAACLNIK
jgi:hypothetical protein